MKQRVATIEQLKGYISKNQKESVIVMIGHKNSVGTQRGIRISDNEEY